MTKSIASLLLFLSVSNILTVAAVGPGTSCSLEIPCEGQLIQCIDTECTCSEGAVAVGGQCRQVPCGPLVNPENGTVSISESVETQEFQAKYTCNDGYLLEGESLRICPLEVTRWSGSQPICRPVSCPTIAQPVNGFFTITGEGTQLNSVVTYTCEDGYILNGAETRTCLSTGQWSNDPPTCPPRPCSRLDPIINGEISYTTDLLVFRTIARYTCITGHILVGDSSRECTANGTWSGQDPVCEPESSDPTQSTTTTAATTTSVTTTTGLPTTTCDLDCLNFGSCFVLDSGISMCDCAIGFSGDLCEIEDYCTTQPCADIAVECLRLPSSRVCVCPVGLKGPDCTEDDPVVTCKDFEETVYLENGPNDDERSICLPQGGTTAEDICYNPNERLLYVAETGTGPDLKADIVMDSFCLKYIGSNADQSVACVMLTAYEEDDRDYRPYINDTANICFIFNNPPEFEAPFQHTVGFTSTEQQKILPLLIADSDPHQTHTFTVTAVLPDTMATNFGTTEQGLRIVKPVDLETASQTVQVTVMVKDNGVPPLNTTQQFIIEILLDSDIVCEITPPPPILFHVPDGLPSQEEGLGQISCPDVGADSGLTFVTKGSTGPVRADEFGKIVYDPSMSVTIPENGNFEATVTASVLDPVPLSKDFVVHVIADDFRPSCEAPNPIKFSERTAVGVCSVDFVCTERANVNETCEDDSLLFDVSCEPGVILSNTRVKICVAENLINNFGNYQVTVQVSNSYGITALEVPVTVDNVNNPPEIVFNQQKISVPENETAGYDVVFVTVLDPDSAQTSSSEVLSASLTDNTNGQASVPFEVTVATDQSGVTIVTTAPLDVRAVSSYGLLLQVRDAAGLSDSIILSITVQDVNEAPTCTTTTVPATVSVRSNVGDTVVALQCSDPDVEPAFATLTYSIAGSDLFSVDGQGVVKVAGSLAGFTDSNSVTFRVVVRDGQGLSVNITVEVTINNSFPPECTDLPYKKSLSEDTQANVCFDVSTNCVDEVQNGRLSFTFVSGNGTQYFRISDDSAQTSSLQLCTLESLKHRYGTYIINLKVSSPYGEIQVPVTVNINDVNDPPTFASTSYTEKISEDTTVGSEVFSLSATDPDSGAFGKVSYFSRDINPNFFVLNADDGRITLQGKLDAETGPASFNFTVEAEDGAPSPLTDSTQVMINVLDVNDNAPVCTYTQMEATLQLIDQVGTVVQTLSCIDSDVSPQYNLIGFRLKDTTQQVFSVSTDGVVTLNTGLVREVTSYVVEVEVYNEDSPNDPGLTTVVTIQVFVNIDIPPECKPPTVIRTLRETQPVGDCIDSEIICTDKTGGQMELLQESGTGQEYMEIRLNQGSSQLGLNACIKKSIKNQFGQYQLLVDVTNGLATTTVNWTFTVENLNEAPYFDKDVFETIVDETIESSSPILNITADDPDENYDENDFKIRSLKAVLANSDVFSNQLDNVILFVEAAKAFYGVRPMNATTRNKYKYDLTVTDGKGLYDKATAVINIRDVNSPPICPQTQSKVTINILIDVGNAVSQVFCYDTDIDPQNKRLQYKITDGDQDNHFNITDDGTVIVIKKFPRTPLYGRGTADLVIQVSDYGSPSFNVTVNLIVIVDNQIPPECEPVVTPPDIWVINSVATLSMGCTDPTVPGQTGHLGYSQSGNYTDGFILTDKGGGVLELRYSLTVDGTYQIQIRVDNQLRARIYTELIEVRYLAATPVFNNTDYKQVVNESVPVGSIIVTVQATSAQLVGDLIYHVIGDSSSPDWDTYFSLGSNSGKIVTLTSLRGLANKVVRLRVEAEDTGSRLRSASNVVITVLDFNEQPQCTVSPDLDIDVTATAGTEVVSFSCSDPDVKPEYSRLTYALVGSTVQGVFQLSPASAPVAIVTANELSVTVPVYTFQMTVTDGAVPALTYSQDFTVTVSLLPPPLNIEIMKRTYASIMVRWSYDRADFYSVTSGYQVILSRGQGAVAESSVLEENIREFNMTDLTANTSFSVSVRAFTDYGQTESAPILVITPEVPILSSFLSTIRVLSEDFNLLHRDTDSQLYFELKRRIVQTFNNILHPTAGYAGSNVEGFRPYNSILIDMITYVNQSGSVARTIAFLESKIRSGHLEDFDVDSAYFQYAEGDGYIMIEDITHDPVDIFNGSVVTVTCDILTVGYPETAEFSFWWTYNGTILQPTGQSRYSISNETSSDIHENKKSFLRISPILNSNEGVYGCVAADKNYVQVASRDLALSVLSQPVVSLTPRSQTVNQGDPVILMCELVSEDNTFIQFVWYKDGRPLQDTGGLMVTQVVRNETLTITIIQASAVYGCEGRGPAGTGQRVLSNIGVIPTGPAGNIFCEITTEVRNNYVIRWPMTAINTVAVDVCPPGYIGEVTRPCDNAGQWQTSIHNCRKETIQQINNDVKAIQDGSSTKNLSVAISELAEETGRSLLDGDLSVALDTMDTVATIVADPHYDPLVTVTEAVEDTVNYLRIASNLIDTGTVPTWESRLAQDLEGAIAVPRNVESFIKARINKMAPTEDYFRTFAEANVYAEVGKGGRNGYVFPDRTQAGTPDWLKDTETNIHISTAAIGDYVSTGYGSSFYRNIPKVLSTRFKKDGNVDSTNRDINADTVTFQVIGDIGIVNPPAVITFQHILTNYSDPQCCSWDFNENAYVTDGCELLSTSDEKTVCSCNHFTNFAVLMSPGKTPAADLKALSIISAVGCALSIFCLLLTIISHLMVWRLVKSDRAVLLMNLCVALIISYVIFLAGIGRAEHEDVCTAVSLLLHFFYLAVFFLMLAYGIEIAVTVIYVFVTNSRIKWLLPLAWGIPLVIVAISAGVTQLDGYGNENFCWLSIEDGLIWAFVGPAACVILFNFIIVIAVFRKMFKSSAMLTKTDKEKAKAGVRSMCVLLPILGLTWVFGIFSVNEDLVVFQYIFAVCNTLQGLFIFLFHCVFNSQLKDAFKHRKARKKSLQSFDKSFKNHHSSTSATAFYSDNSNQNNDSGFTTESSNPFLEADRQVKEMVAKNKKGANLYDNALKPEQNTKPSSTAVDLEDVKISNILRESEVMGGTTGISSILQTQSTSLPDTTRITDEEKEKGGMIRSSVTSHKYDYIDSPVNNKPKYDQPDSTVYIRAETEKPSSADKPYTQRLVTSADNVRSNSAIVKEKAPENLTDKQKGKIYGGRDKGGNSGSGDRKGAGKSQLSKSSKSSRSDDDYEPTGSSQNISSISTALPTITYDQYQAKTKRAEPPKKQKESSLKKKDKKKPKDRSKAYEYSFESTYLGDGSRDGSRHASLENMNMQHYSPYTQMPGMSGYHTGRPTHQQQHWDQYRYQQRQPYYRGDYW